MAAISLQPTPAISFHSVTNFSLWLQSSTKILVLILVCVFLQAGASKAARQLLDDQGSSNKFNVLNLRALHTTSSRPARGVGMKVFHEDSPHLIRGGRFAQETTQKTRAISYYHKHDLQTRPGLKSTTVRRQQDSAGQYYMPLQLGSPGKDILVIIDTGSEILWVQCQPCNQCGPQIIEPIFDPALSSTYTPVPCDSQRCLQHSSDIITSCTNSSTSGDDHSLCNYQVFYGDNSTSAGDLSLETLTLNSSSTSGSIPMSTAITDFEFGCGHTNEGIEAELGASGLMGLDRGQSSFISQISEHYSQVFFYCFPDRINNLNSSGFIHFGDSYVSKHLQYTPLVQNTASAFLSQFYYVNVTGISVNGHLLPIPHEAFLIDDVSGNGGTILDTGTSLSGLVDPAFDLLKEALLNHTKHLERAADDPSGIGLDICYNVSASASHRLPKMPQVWIHLEGKGVELRLSAENLLLVAAADDEHVTLCLAMRSAGGVGSGRNVIGNYQQANHIIETDIPNSRVGFGDANCAMD